MASEFADETKWINWQALPKNKVLRNWCGALETFITFLKNIAIAKTKGLMANSATQFRLTKAKTICSFANYHNKIACHVSLGARIA
jgi:hypothetical protein